MGSAIEVHGLAIQSPKEGQAFEIQTQKILLLGDCPEDYPLQPSKECGCLFYT